jgi:hypothetical protein
MRTPQPWSAFEADAPDLATAARILLRRGDGDSGFLATVRGLELAPRIHPVSVAIVDGHLEVFVLSSAKRADLEQDGRYAFHAHLDPDVPRELSFRGRAVVVDDPARRASAIAAWPFEPDDTYELLELLLETVVVGRRASSDDWPPRYETWSAPEA